ncbi:MAG: DNA polymerase III subunit gamma/tau [Prevotella sp.]|nr:DNA polymerase III subunit gamma/tau [Prevotella sp.]
MEYIVSARKYRPMSFDTVVGQQTLTTTLKNAVKSGKLAHAYLFCGPRGVGKTTCARIFAKVINCEHPHDDGEACNECESCRAFNEQRSYNIFELDAASNNGVDQIKALMEQTRIPPQVGKYKVFIIDEVHMLSTQAFNAFLKTLEEPPAHVIFILATTEKHKILPTIISRCQIYDFERMTVPNIVDHLKMVAQKEGITYEEEALGVIAEKADGGMRDALSIFDQAVSFCQGNITYQKVIEDLNVLDSDNYFNIIDLSLQNKVADIMVLVNNIVNKGFDGSHLISGLAMHVRNLLMAKDPQTLPLLEVSQRQRDRYQQQADQCAPAFLFKALRLMNDCDINYRQSSNKRLLVELTLIQVAQITQEDDSPAAGRSPKRLKTLFKKLIGQIQQQAAPQVAAAGQTPAQTPATTPTAAQHAATSQAPTTAQQQATAPSGIAQSPAETPQPPVRPAIKLSQLGSTFGNLLRKDRHKTEEQTSIPDDLSQHQPFDEDQLRRQWTAMCNRMPQSLIGVATRLKNMTPRITQMPQVELLVDNDILLGEVNKIKGRIRSTLALSLHNSDIELVVRLANTDELKPILSKREEFELMQKNNPALGKLTSLLQLELV